MAVYERADICPGIPPIYADLYAGKHDVAQRLFASGLHWHGVRVHPTHTLAFCKGIIFCTKCGNYSTKIVRALSLKCKMKISNPQAGKNLRKLLDGVAPHGVRWPEPGALRAPDNVASYLTGGDALD